MTKKDFKDLCYSFQKTRNGYEYSDDFDAYGVVNALNFQGIEFDDLNSHEILKDWFKHCIDEEYNVGPQITRWFNEGFADFYKIDFSMGTIGSITALATAEDFYEAFEDRFDDDEEEEDE